MLDLPSAGDWEDVLSIIEEHLGLDEQDHEEVMDRFSGEVRDAFINEPTFPESDLAKSLAEAKQEKRKRHQVLGVNYLGPPHCLMGESYPEKEHASWIILL